MVARRHEDGLVATYLADTTYRAAVFHTLVDKVSFQSPLWMCEHSHDTVVLAEQCAREYLARHVEETA